MERLIPFRSEDYIDPAHTDVRFNRPLSALQEKSVHFEFEMKDAALYALKTR
ncbi:MAG: hypothetical protein IJN82_06275 [Clostridia bacterium]|nr:hypothetical protein [Clostridia bacterium]